MSKRRRLSRPVLIAVAIIGVLSLTAGLLFVVPRGPALPKASPDFYYEEVDPSKTAPDFTLRDQFGKAVRLSDFRGKIAVLAFWYSNCTHSCQINAYTIALLPELVKRRLPNVADDINFLAVTLDPEVDTQEQRKLFVDTFVTKYGGSLLFLGGDRSEVAPVWNDYEVFVEKRSLSQYLQQSGLTEEELLQQTSEDLETSFHAELPEEIKQELLDNIHVSIATDYYILHRDVIYIIKDGKLRFKILGHDIDREKFAELLTYVASRK